MAKARRQSNEELSQSISAVGKRPRAVLFKNGAFSWSADENIVSFDGIELNHNILLSGSNISFLETGIYKASVKFRSTADVWSKWYTTNSAGVLKGESHWGGSGQNFSPDREWLFAVDATGIYQMRIFSDLVDSIVVPAPGGSFLGSATRTLQLVIEKVSDL